MSLGAILWREREQCKEKSINDHDKMLSILIFCIRKKIFEENTLYIFSP